MHCSQDKWQLQMDWMFERLFGPSQKCKDERRIHRTQQGQWNFSVCSLASEQLCNKLSVLIQILPVNPEINAAEASRQHTFSVTNSSFHNKETRMMDDLDCQSLSLNSILFKLRVYVLRASDNQDEGSIPMRNILDINDS